MALRVWLPLNGNLNNQGLSVLTPSGTPTFLNTGKMGKCVSLTPRVSFTGLPKLDNFTILFWLKVDSCSADWADSLGFYSYATDDSKCADFRFEATISSRACSFHNNSPYAITQGSRILITSSQFGEWHHCGVSYNGTNLYTYIDGILTYTDTGLGGYLKNYFHIGQTNQIVGGMNDLRIYDECLSQKQIKEISKGLVAHYKLDNPYIETTTNIAPGINGITSYSTNNSPAWDISLNGTPMITPSGWSSGYNGGVTDPTHGYHAHWVREGELWEMIFPNLNSVINQKGRWLGISAGGLAMANIVAGQKYTISYWQKTDNLNLTARAGIYYKKTSDGNNNFWDGCNAIGYNTKLNTWQFMSRTYTRSSEYVQHDTSQSIYVYGDNSSQEGTVYVKDVQIVRGDHSLPYAIGTRNGQKYEVDCSGNGYHGIISGSLSYNPDSARYSGSTSFSGSNWITSVAGSMSWFSFDNLTVSAWMYPTITPSDWIGSIGIQHDGGVESKVFSISNYAGNFSVHTDTGSGWVTTQSNALPLNKWSYCVATLTNGTDLKMYINGILVKTATINYNTATVRSDTRLSVGIDLPGGDEKYTGSYSDVRFYATALSADEILTMYKNSGIIDNKGNVYAYEFKEE